MVALTPSGEVAVFVDDDQFGPGQSVEKCGPECVSTFWHSVQPGKSNPYHAADIHGMAHSDYVKYMGPDTASDQAGTSNQVLYDMLAEHQFKYFIGPLDWGWINGWLAAGYPVIIGGVSESTVKDEALGKNPYNWNTSGLFHIILATGLGLFRDTANIDTNGLVRPGPRHYDTQALRFTTATMVVPSWMPVPPNGTPPTPTPPAPAVSMYQAYWDSTGTSAPFNTGIAASWVEEWKAGKRHGPPLGKEFDTVNKAGQNIKAQCFPGGDCQWNRLTGVGTWEDWQ